MLENPIERLRAQIAAGELDADQAQLEVAQRLDTLSWQLGEWQAARSGFWARLSRAYVTPPRGLYIYGPVGRGKSMLMDLFYACVDFTPKLRRHFHEFMVDAHERIAAARFECDGDPIPHVARAFAEEGALLCFDELHVADIADAMILGRLFKHLFELGVVVVATSNAAPAWALQEWAQPAALPALHRSHRRAHGDRAAQRREGLQARQARRAAALFLAVR